MKAIQRFASAAPDREDREDREEDHQDQLDQSKIDHETCEMWVEWIRTRKCYGSPRPLDINILAKLRAPMRVTATDDRDGIMSAELQNLNIAIIAQPDNKSKQAFLMYYLDGSRPVKKIARRLNVSRKHVYHLISKFRRNALQASRRLGHNFEIHTSD